MDTTILIVEDHDAVRRLLHEWLQAVFPRYRFQEAISGEDAIALVQAGPPDLVLMDLSLPQMNGIEATRHIKVAVPTMPVVILTIHEDHAYRADALAAGASAYVSKRAMQAELVPVLTALLPARHTAPDDETCLQPEYHDS